ncbi:MAG: hypothetical protein IIY12_06140 [Clostridia bacterium]|nr:hypothetical protein [Clostridia bacterium]
MKLILNGTDDSFDVIALSNLFFPRDGFTEEKGKRLTVTRNGDTFEAVLEWNGTRWQSAHKVYQNLHDGERCAIKRACYDVFSEATGIQSPWGILSGVRPVRFYESLLKIYGEKTEETLRDFYLVTQEKIDLCKQTILHQAQARQQNRSRCFLE